MEAIYNKLLSDDYKERFVGEYQLVKDKYDKLHKMIIEREAGVLSFEPTCTLDIWKAQASAMGQYLYWLEVRAVLEDITL